MAESILSARGVWKIFGKGAEVDASGSAPEPDDLRARGLVVGVQEASFDIPRGEIFIIMGLSGSGKSTLLRCLTGLHPISRGEIVIDGVNIATASAAELLALRRDKIGMVFQSFALLPHLTALDNAAFPLQVRGMAKPERRAKAEAVLKLVGLTGLEHRLPREMSGGQQQRVGIARSLIADPAVWFLDEPFSALDPLIRREMQDEFRRLQQQLHKTIIFVTHDLEEAVRLGDRIAIMQDGKVLQIGTPEDLVMNPFNDYVARFVAGLPKARVIRTGTVARPLTDAATGTPVRASDTLHDVSRRVVMSDTPVPVADADGKPIAQISRAEIVSWLE